jgi:hypothetical protein
MVKMNCGAKIPVLSRSRGGRMGHAADFPEINLAERDAKWEVLGPRRHIACHLPWLRTQDLPDARSMPGAAAIFARMLRESALGNFGNENLALLPFFHRAAAILLAGGLLAAALGLRRSSGVESRAALWVAAVVVLNLLLVAYNCWFVAFSPQGSYVVLSALLLTISVALAPKHLFGGRAAAAWTWLYVAFFLAAAIEMGRILYSSPCT